MFTLLLGYAVGSRNSKIRIHVHIDTTMKSFRSKSCDVLNPYGVIFIEAILFAADQLQQDGIIEEGELGIRIVDTCVNTKTNPYLLVREDGMMVVGPYSY